MSARETSFVSSASALCSEDAWANFFAKFLELNIEGLCALGHSEPDSIGGVMLKYEKTCIRFSLCGTQCPTHAISMKKLP